MHIAVAFQLLCVGPKGYQTVLRMKRVGSSAKGFLWCKRPAWCKVYWVFGSALCHNHGDPLLKSRFWLKGLCRFSQTWCFIATVLPRTGTTLGWCNLPCPRSDHLKAYNVLGQCLASTSFLKKLRCPRFIGDLPLKSFHSLQLQACVDQLMTWLSFTSGVHVDAAYPWLYLIFLFENVRSS